MSDGTPRNSSIDVVKSDNNNKCSSKDCGVCVYVECLKTIMYKFYVIKIKFKNI